MDIFNSQNQQQDTSPCLSSDETYSECNEEKMWWSTKERSDEPYIIGIDEAGRGPVLGPMVYGACMCAASFEKELAEHPYRDSKTLNETQREGLFIRIQNSTSIHWIAHSISPKSLSGNMLRVDKVNLNTISHDSAICLIRTAIAQGFNVTKAILDTVGPPESYQQKLQRIFPALEIIVSKKADSIYPIVSAASICAKVHRDTICKKMEVR